MGIKKNLIVSLTIVLTLFLQLYFCNENKVLSQNSDVTSNAVNSVKASNDSVDDLWRDLWCVKCGNDITIMKNGRPVPQNSKEYFELLKVCEQY